MSQLGSMMHPRKIGGGSAIREKARTELAGINGAKSKVERTLKLKLNVTSCQESEPGCTGRNM